jgi:serine/threonine-protein kinase
MDPQTEIQERLRQATLGEYDILGQLGFGGMASVYLAHDLALDRRVAIKVMSPVMMFGAGLVDRFRLEARTAAALSHPNIIPIYAVREADGLLYFVMKAVEGTSLDAVIAEAGPLPIPMVEAFLAQAGGALGYAHRHGVVHRDVKPANILLDEEGWVVVTDFGIAKVADTSALTMTGVAVGTPTYMSPEQCAGDPITGASDQYSLGIVVYEMLTGRPPFVDRSVPALMIGHTTRPPPSIEAVRPDCPVALRTAVERMLAKDPADRFPTVEDAVAGADARPLAPDDLTRGTLVTLARTSRTRELMARVRTPRSPVPSLQRPVPTRGDTRPARQRGWFLIGGGITAGAAATAVLALGLWRDKAPAAGLRPDSIPAGAVAPAESPLAPAPAPAGSNEPIPAPPPAPLAAAAERAPGRDGRPGAGFPEEAGTTPETASPNRPVPEAAARTAIDTPVAIAPAPVPVPPPAPAPAPVPPPPPAPIAVDPRVEIESVVHAYARALEAGRLDQAVALFPAMPPDQRQGLEAFYRDGGSMRTRWQVQDIQVTGAVATLRIVGANTIQTSRSGSSEQRVALRARLERGPSGWRLVGLVN